MQKQNSCHYNYNHRNRRGHLRPPRRLLPAFFCCVVTLLTFVPVSAPVFASENITSYSTTVTVNHFFQWGDTLWVATSGGLRVHNIKTGATEFISNSRIFPDLHLTAVSRDSRGNLWIGSRGGYLYKRTPRGQFTTFSNYKIAGWGILSLYAHDDLIVVGSNLGASLFDPARGVALRNAAAIANFSNPRVNTIRVFRDTLFLGCEEGMVYIDGLDAAPLVRRNFYDPGIWKVADRRRAVSLIEYGGSVYPFASPAVVFRNRIYTDSSGWLVAAVGDRPPEMHITNQGGLRTFYNEGDRRLWIGTDESFYFSYDGDFMPPVQHEIGGFTLRMASRVVVSPADGNVWFLPRVPHPNVLWHHAIYRYDGQNWFRYNHFTHSYDIFGYIGDGDALGFAAGRDSTVWVGTWGGNVKHIDPHRNSVAQLVVGNRGFRHFDYITDGIGAFDWGKVDALAMDTSGYLWISVFDSDHGSIICYDTRRRPNFSWEDDPPRAGYRRFFKEQPLWAVNIAVLHADANNRIFAYDAFENRLTIFSHGGSPLADGIIIDTLYEQFGAVSAIGNGDDGDVYIAGTGGIMRIAAGSPVVERVDNTITNVTSLAVLGDVLWLGTSTGILRYDLGKGEKKWIDESVGLPSNDVISVALDRKNGHLWIVTDVGVSQLDIGRGGDEPRPRRTVFAFPNVFSVSGNNQGVQHVTFTELGPRSSVSVYTVNGTLVATVDAEHFTDSEWRALWVPRRNLAPGTYIAVARPSGKRAKIILRP
ncbi:MAG: hypothetical protein LBC70_09525 [Chitinispirillales bacterium]|jgi:hypothetical protein|nr:hypothetical protein [Chitinispirillales bacterium]